METTGSYVPQDTDPEQNGYQEFQGQLDYMQGHQQQHDAQESADLRIQNKMSAEYQNQLKAQGIQN